VRSTRWIWHYWPEALLFISIALPWVSLFALGLYWLWQSGHVLMWAVGATALGVVAWPASFLVRRRADKEARLALGEFAAAERNWKDTERAAWDDVLIVAGSTPPFSFASVEPFFLAARSATESVAQHFHPEARSAWARFNLPDFLLLTERISRDLRRETLRQIPGVSTIRFSHLLWVHQQNSRYGKLAQTGWQVGFGIWRAIRAALNPIQAASQETSSLFVENAARVLSYRLRAYATRLFVLEVGRAAIDLYSGRLRLSDEELRAAQVRDMSPTVEAVVPIRIVLIGQINAGKSSLINALAQETRSAVSTLPTTTTAAEHLLDLKGHPSIVLVDTPGFDSASANGIDILGHVERSDLVLWVASTTQPARDLDEHLLASYRHWANALLLRRPPSVILALTHVDELRPASEWRPPYNVTAPQGRKEHAICAAMKAAARALDLPLHTIVPVAVPPGREHYNLGLLWAKIAGEADDARLVQLDRIRLASQERGFRDTLKSFRNASRTIMRGVVEG
jgi:uncharacterized protein